LSLGIETIPAYSPEARGRNERAFATHPGRLRKELAAVGITSMQAANRHLQEVCLPAFDAEFKQPAVEPGSAFAPCLSGPLEGILCEQFERTVGQDNCIRFEGLVSRSPDRHHSHDLKAKVRVHRHQGAVPKEARSPGR
jgi:hypothetical protein